MDFDNGTKWRVKKIKSDNGTAFKNSTMKNFFDEKGTTHTFLTPRTPQQNDVVERKNMTLIEEFKLPTYFWAEAINTVCYTQNISIVNQEQGKITYQLMNNKKPTINFLRVFGCKCFVLRNQSGNLGKFEAKANEEIFVGYAATRAYRVYNLRMNIFMELVHVVFDDKKIQGLVDEGNHGTLQFENEHIGDVIESDEEECSHGKTVSVDVIPSMDNPNSSMDNLHPSMDNFSVDRHTSTDNPSTDKSSSRCLNSFSGSMNLGGSFSKSEIIYKSRNPYK